MTHSPPRRVAALAALILTAGVGLALPAAPAHAAGTPSMSEAHWEYFGFGGDTDKSLSFIGGELSPGGGLPNSVNEMGAVEAPIIQYYPTIDGVTYYPNETAADLPAQVGWTLADGYLPSPISTWKAGPASVTIEHFADHIDRGSATAVFSRVTLANTTTTPITVTLNITAPASLEVPLTGSPSSSGSTSMGYTLTIPAKSSRHEDFAALANGAATAAQLAAAGGYDANYRSMAAYWNAQLSRVAMPTSLPDTELVDMYKASLIEGWESLSPSGGGLLPYGSGGNESGMYNYSRTFPHDVEDIVTEYVREGDYATAADVLTSPTYASYAVGAIPSDYLDTIPKWIEPFAYYQQYAHNPSLFTATIKSEIETAAHRVDSLRVTTPGDPHDGLMQASNTFDNGSDYLMVDDLAAMFGLQAYADLALSWAKTDASWTAEATWAHNEATSIDNALNAYLTAYTIPRLGGAFSGCLDACTKAPANAYNGNYLGTTLAMSSMPWDGTLAGNTLGGTWQNYLDTSVYAAFSLRSTTAASIPAHSWGAWSNTADGYGTIYNAGAGASLLGSGDPDLRTEAIADVEWLQANQSAPMQWGESFAAAGAPGSWTTPLADYESWGLTQTDKALLESSISVAFDGTRIIGRGIPTDWITSGRPVSWTDVPVGAGATAGFSITGLSGDEIHLTLTGNTSAPTQFELPVFVDNIKRVSTGTVDEAAGTVTLPAGTTQTTVTIDGYPVTTAQATDMGSTDGGVLTLGATGAQSRVAQTFTADNPTVTGVRVAVRKDAATGTAQTDLVAQLYATSKGLPTGRALATATEPAGSITDIIGNVTIPLSRTGLKPGQTYAVVLTQASPNASVYQWAVADAGGRGLDQTTSAGRWQPATGLGDAALTVDTSS